VCVCVCVCVCVFVLSQFKVYAVPAEDFSMDYVRPKVLCVSAHGRFTEDRYVLSPFAGFGLQDLCPRSCIHSPPYLQNTHNLDSAAGPVRPKLIIKDPKADSVNKTDDFVI